MWYNLVEESSWLALFRQINLSVYHFLMLFLAGNLCLCHHNPLYIDNRSCARGKLKEPSCHGVMWGWHVPIPLSWWRPWGWPWAGRGSCWFSRAVASPSAACSPVNTHTAILTWLFQLFVARSNEHLVAPPAAYTGFMTAECASWSKWYACRLKWRTVWFLHLHRMKHPFSVVWHAFKSLLSKPRR